MAPRQKRGPQQCKPAGRPLKAGGMDSSPNKLGHRLPPVLTFFLRVGQVFDPPSAEFKHRMPDDTRGWSRIARANKAGRRPALLSRQKKRGAPKCAPRISAP